MQSMAIIGISGFALRDTLCLWHMQALELVFIFGVLSQDALHLS